MLEDQLRRDLEQSLQTTQFKKTFREVRAQCPVFLRHPDLSDLRELVRAGDPRYRDKDEVLLALLEKLRETDAIFPLIQDLFWGSLTKIFARRRRTVADWAELWDRLVWEFYQVVRTYPLERRPCKIDVNIILDTRKKILRWERDEHTEQKERAALRAKIKRADVARPIELADIQVQPEEMETFLLDLVDRRVITEIQYDIVLDTLVYKRLNQREWAEANAVAYNTVRSLRTRAEQAIGRFVANGHEDED